MIIRSKAPLRIGLAGGGTDVSPYSDIYGGAILNATINMYAYADIEPCENGKIIFKLNDKDEYYEYNSQKELPLDGNLDLIKSIYNKVVKKFDLQPLSFILSTYVDAPPGSGLGTSSTLVVAVLGAFSEWLSLPLGEYDLAYLAYEIERIDLNMAGGKQDQYAATFGGFNFMEFYNNDKVIINPLRIKDRIMNELSNNIVLYYTQTSRNSSDIIVQQQKNVNAGNPKSIDAMHHLKEQAVMMKEALLKGQLDLIGEILNMGWLHKKQMAEGITTQLFEELYNTALQAGATGGKISGAGGGGYIFFYCPGNTRYNVIKALNKYGGYVQKYEFTKMGLETWIS
jgi:D-glycero-alpha-D-manno-heptose-7-phosphate kinase